MESMGYKWIGRNRVQVNRKGWDIKCKRKDGREVDMKRCDVKWKEMKRYLSIWKDGM